MNMLFKELLSMRIRKLVLRAQLYTLVNQTVRLSRMYRPIRLANFMLLPQLRKSDLQFPTKITGVFQSLIPKAKPTKE